MVDVWAWNGTAWQYVGRMSAASALSALVAAGGSSMLYIQSLDAPLPSTRN